MFLGIDEKYETLSIYGSLHICCENDNFGVPKTFYVEDPFEPIYSWQTYKVKKKFAGLFQQINAIPSILHTLSVGFYW